MSITIIIHTRGCNRKRTMVSPTFDTGHVKWLSASNLHSCVTLYCVVLDPENTEGADLQRKLEYLNSIVDQEQRAEQARRQMQYFGHCMYESVTFELED